MCKFWKLILILNLYVRKSRPNFVELKSINFTKNFSKNSKDFNPQFFMNERK